MKKITIIDHENTRVIVAEVPDYLNDPAMDDEEIAEAIFSALGISSSNTEYVIGAFDFFVDVACLNEGGYGNRTKRLEEYTQNFKEDALAALTAARK